MGSDAVRELTEAIRALHNAEAFFVEAVRVREAFQGETVWEGIVHVFDLKDHPKAARCYAWTELVDEVTNRHRVLAVLHLPPVDSPLKAVQVSILQDVKEQRKAKEHGAERT